MELITDLCTAVLWRSWFVSYQSTSAQTMSTDKNRYTSQETSNSLEILLFLELSAIRAVAGQGSSPVLHFASKTLTKNFSKWVTLT